MVIGLTGGVGTGKSSILRMMKENFNAKIIMADEVARNLQMPGGACYMQIIEAFGEDILVMNDPERPIDRAKLAGIVFDDPARLEVLNGIVHPMVREEILRKIADFYREDIAALILVEAALLIESGYTDFLDELWVARADREIRIERLMSSRGYTREKCEQIMASQLTPEEYANAADFIIDNSGSHEETRRQIEERLRSAGLITG